MISLKRVKVHDKNYGVKSEKTCRSHLSFNFSFLEWILCGDEVQFVARIQCEHNIRELKLG